MSGTRNGAASGQPAPRVYPEWGNSAPSRGGPSGPPARRGGTRGRCFAMGAMPDGAYA